MRIERSRTESSYQSYLLITASYIGFLVFKQLHKQQASQRCLQVFMPAPPGNALPRDQYQHYIPRFILRYFQDAQIQPRYIVLHNGSHHG